MVIKLKMGGSNPGGIGLIVMMVQNKEVTLNFFTYMSAFKRGHIIVYDIKQYSSSSLIFLRNTIGVNHI